MPLNVRRYITLLILMLATAAGNASEGIFSSPADSIKEFSWLPEIHGAIRPRWEMLTDGGESRFQVRNVRLIFSGSIAKPIDYYLQLSADLGKLSLRDAWGRLTLAPGVRLQAGQFRLPFGTDCFRGPATYLFANRSFIGSTLNNVRGVGAKLIFDKELGHAASLTLEGGAFNPSSISDQNLWVKTPAFAGRALLTVSDFKIITGAETLKPGPVRINSLSGSLCWSKERWIIEGEVISRHYTGHTFRTARAFNLFADYHFPVRLGIFNQASVQSRFDGMTAYSTGETLDDGRLTVDFPSRRRITAGFMLSYIHKSVRSDLRLNYEKYFYHSGAQIPVGANDKICAEIVVKF